MQLTLPVPIPVTWANPLTEYLLSPDPPTLTHLCILRFHQCLHTSHLLTSCPIHGPPLMLLHLVFHSQVHVSIPSIAVAGSETETARMPLGSLMIALALTSR